MEVKLRIWLFDVMWGRRGGQVLWWRRGVGCCLNYKGVRVRRGGGKGEEASVELEDVAAEQGGEASVIRGLLERLGHGREVGDNFAEAFEQVEPTAFGEESDAFGEGAEDAAGEELGDGLGCMMVLPCEVVGEDGELGGGFPQQIPFGNDKQRKPQ